MNEDNINYKVCLKCDAPLPNSSEKLNYFNLNPNICDDCYYIIDNESKTE